ncbi:phospholipid carrier-dependent glycosyltransferase [Ktedonobacter racemifer]|uniref:Glycosyl transferase family 39 n=1 Tax=Ktedonobacter racemifer DSM 44963 TaxID=485913 RepID=D6TL54_KTERA|nr:phospholipid carrier-dependent glycosyltransferase [Ktedonobacter racemifer]EFH86504.1 glycosyl transferase family 39 [Ktedonobacter racemifer DSM 44963]
MRRKFVWHWQLSLLLVIALLGLGARLYGLNWDMGENFHPDERQILFRVAALGWPVSLAQFLDPDHSPLNPHFFAYGSLPLYLLAGTWSLLSRLFAWPLSYAALSLVGRAVSALFDTGSLLLTAWLARLLTGERGFSYRASWSVALLAAGLVAFTPLQLQLSHFYTVDTLLLFFVLLTLVGCVKYVLTRHDLFWLSWTGISFGLALATKFSAAPLGLPIVIAVLLRYLRKRDIAEALVGLLSPFLLAVVAFFVTQPYAWLDMHNYIAQVTEQGTMARGGLDYPYVRQFAGTLPYLYQGYNLLFWGLGLTLGLAAICGFCWGIWATWRGALASSWWIIFAWMVTYSAITGSFYVKFMRYLLPIYPLCALLAATVLVALVTAGWSAPPVEAPAGFWRRLRGGYGPRLVTGALLVLVVGGTLFQGLALLQVYSQPNTRIQASRWLYAHLARGSVLTYEQWDDALPVAIDGHDPSYFVQASYADTQGNMTTGLGLYDDDTLAKARVLARLLPTLDAITMASDRLDKSIPRMPERYPLTIRYYQLLFQGQLGFRLTAQFEVRPHLLGITLDDSMADESYSVFDHPMVRIFVRQQPYPYTSEQVYQKLISGLSLPEK